jgi:hypothetical protein
MLAYIIIFGLLALSNGATFLLDNEGWTIAGNKRIIEAKHQSYSLGSKMSNYILGTDDLVNVDARNRDDKNLWYFRSPPIHLVKRPVLMVFTITSFSGDFTKLNAGAPSVKITGADNLIFSFDKAVFDGKMTTINVPFVYTNENETKIVKGINKNDNDHHITSYFFSSHCWVVVLLSIYF